MGIWQNEKICRTNCRDLLLEENFAVDLNGAMSASAKETLRTTRVGNRMGAQTTHVTSTENFTC